jgi:hypothetical protein
MSLQQHRQILMPNNFPSVIDIMERISSALGAITLSSVDEPGQLFSNLI